MSIADLLKAEIQAVASQSEKPPADIYFENIEIVKHWLGFIFEIDITQAASGLHTVKVKTDVNFDDLDLHPDLRMMVEKNEQSLKEIVNTMWAIAKGQSIPTLPDDAWYTEEEARDAVKYFYKGWAISNMERAQAANRDDYEAYAKKVLEARAKPDNVIDNGITLYPENGGVCRAFIPNREAFPEQVAKLTEQHLLSTVFREGTADMEMFCLGLGKALVGRNNSKDTLTNKLYNHQARISLLVLGSPGVGKTTLQEMILNTAKTLGYTNEAIHPQGFDYRFIGPRFFLADFGVLDDAKNEFIANMAGSSVFKTTVTSGSLMAENKSQHPVEVVPNCFVWVNTNKFAADAFLKSDDGAVDRMTIVSTLDADDLKDLELPESFSYGDVDDVVSHAFTTIKGDNNSFGPFIENLAKTLEVKQQTLIMWLMRLCVDKFMKQFDDKTLKHTHTVLKAKLEYVQPKDALTPLVCAIQFAMVLAGHRVGEGVNVQTLTAGFNALISLHSNMSKEYYDIKQFLKEDWVDKACPWNHPYTTIKWLTDASALSMYVAVNGGDDNINKLVQGQKVSEYFTTVLNDARFGSNGMKVKASTSELNKNWVRGCKKLTTTINPIIDTMIQQDVPTSIDQKLNPTWVNKMQEVGFSRQTITQQYELI